MHVRAGLKVVTLSRSSSCCRGLAGIAVPPLGDRMPQRRPDEGRVSDDAGRDRAITSGRSDAAAY